jgi:excisionase family DNA binding protein
MMSVLDRPPLSSPTGTSAKLKASSAWQEALWQRWTLEENWPAKMDVYEAAAYLRVSPDTIRRAVVVARDGKARLTHQRLGSVYRFRKSDLDAFGSVPGRI